MCVNTLCFLFAFLSVLISDTAAEQTSTDFRYITVPDGIIDAEINGAGDIYILLPGLPHLRIYSADGDIIEYDLSDILLPGGMCIDERWGWYVTGEISNKVYHFDNAGELTDYWDSRGLPGDICLSGFSIMYVSRAEGAISRLDESTDILVRLNGAGDGQLTGSGREAVYSDADESILFGDYSPPEQLPRIGAWAIAGEELLVLNDSCVCSSNGSLRFQLPQYGEFSRIGCSKSGNHCLLWSPGEGRILVLQ